MTHWRLPDLPLHTYMQGVTMRHPKMTTKRNHLLARVGAVFGAFGSAVAAGTAVEEGRKPRERDLNRLGIDAAAYRAIGH